MSNNEYKYYHQNIHDSINHDAINSYFSQTSGINIPIRNGIVYHAHGNLITVIPTNNIYQINSSYSYSNYSSNSNSTSYSSNNNSTSGWNNHWKGFAERCRRHGWC